MTTSLRRLMYLLVAQPKAAELGRIAFGAGLLAFLLHFSGSLSIVAHGG